jgi:lipoprotein-anchoring transpeptidase ErfK/SrfK
MSGLVGKAAAAIAAAAVLGAVGAGIYASIPYATAGEQKAVAAQAPPLPSASASSVPVPDAEKPAPAALRDTPPAAPSVPASSAPAAKPAAPATGPCAQTGPAQLAVEKYLAAHPDFGPVTVDGQQSAGDCAAIKKFQTRYGVQPVAGYAGPVSGKVAKRLESAAIGKCSVKGTTICVDLTSQTMWLVKDGAIAYGPAPIRTGRAGMAISAGFYSISDKKTYTVSSIFKVALPYWQRFNGGMGFHATPSYLYDNDSPGSHGCINLLRHDAIALYGLTRSGTRVHIFGAKPGT